MDVLRQIDSRLNQNLSTFIVTPYSESLVAAQKDEEFRNILNKADFALPDGAGVLWAAKFLTSPQSSRPPQKFQKEFSGYPEPSPIAERVPGRKFFLDLCALAESRGESVFLLGGFNDTPEIVARKLKEKFSSLKIAGTYAPNFSDCHCEVGRPKQSAHQGDCRATLAMTETVNSSKADFLFVALGPIFQEKWISHNFQNLRAKLVMGVGGTFDYIAGKKPLPPRFLSSHGLEWFWRLFTQPKRFFRIAKGVLGLIWLVFRARLRN